MVEYVKIWQWKTELLKKKVYNIIKKSDIFAEYLLDIVKRNKSQPVDQSTIFLDCTQTNQTLARIEHINYIPHITIICKYVRLQKYKKLLIYNLLKII